MAIKKILVIGFTAAQQLPRLEEIFEDIQTAVISGFTIKAMPGDEFFMPFLEKEKQKLPRRRKFYLQGNDCGNKRFLIENKDRRSNFRPGQKRLKK